MNLAEALPAEQARCREILENAIELSNGGYALSLVFLISSLKIDLAEAEMNAASGDVVAMLRSYQKLKEYKS